MIGNISQSTGSGLQELLRSSQKGQEEMWEQSDLVPADLASGLDSATISAQATNTSQNMMSRNFASAEREESRHTQATIQGLQVNRQMNDSKQNTLMSIMQQAKVEYENTESLGEKYKVLRRAENKIFWHQQDEVSKSAEETHLKGSKETLEVKVKEAMTSKDENGDPIEAGGTGSAGEVAPMPEVSGSNPAPVPDTAAPAPVTTVTGSAVASMPTPALDVSTPTVPSTPSIDITV